MAQAQGSLSSGVPFSSVAIPQRSSIAPTGASLSPDFGAPASPRKAFILQFSDGLFLHGYRSDGVYATGDLQQAKHFWTRPESAAELFQAEICTVIVNADGSGVRRTLLDCAATGAPKTPERKPHEANQQALDEEVYKEGHACAGHCEASGAGERRRTTSTLVDKTNPASDSEESEAGARADGDGQVPPSFLVRNILTTQRAQLEDGKRLLFHFIEEFLQIELFGLQSGFGLRPDCLLFVGPHGSTLAVPVDTLLEPREIALEIIRSKIESSHKQFTAVK